MTTRRLSLVLLLAMLAGPQWAWSEPAEGLSDELVTADRCVRLGAMLGPEDFVYDHCRKRLLVSSQDRRHPERRGAIYSVSLAEDDLGTTKWLALRGRDDCSFHPHGIFLRDEHLYVVNHHESADHAADKGCIPDAPGVSSRATSVEIFEVGDEHLRFVRRLADPRVLSNGNDLVVDSEGTIYVTIHPWTMTCSLREMFFGHACTKIVRFRCADPAAGVHCRGDWDLVQSFGRYLNGIELWPDEDGHELIVSATAEPHFYRLAASEGELKVRETWEIQDSDGRKAVGHDNLNLLSDGSILVGSHPELRRYLQHASSPEARSPSAVWKIRPPSSEEDDPQAQARPLQALKVFGDDGTRFSGVSAADCVAGHLVIGQVYGQGVLLCRDASVCSKLDPPNGPDRDPECIDVQEENDPADPENTAAETGDSK